MLFYAATLRMRDQKLTKAANTLRLSAKFAQILFRVEKICSISIIF